MHRLITLVINLDGSDDRMSSARQQLEAAGIAFERLPATDGRRLNIASLPYHDTDATLRYFGRPVNGGEIGCYLSHMASLKRFLASDAGTALVLEDDVRLAAGFAQHIADLTAWLGTQHDLDWHVINLGNRTLKISTPLHGFGPHVLYRAHYFPMTTTALLWSRAGAEAILADSLPITAPVDNMLRKRLTRSQKGLAFRPPLASTTGANSDIDTRSDIARSKTRRGALYGLRKQRRLWGDKILALRAKYLG
jgi:glycosyl transferase family 25